MFNCHDRETDINHPSRAIVLGLSSGKRRALPIYKGHRRLRRNNIPSVPAHMPGVESTARFRERCVVVSLSLLDKPALSLLKACEAPCRGQLGDAARGFLVAA
jgi:hypothetical protein